MNTRLPCTFLLPCSLCHLSINNSAQCPQTSAAPATLKGYIPNSVTSAWGQLCYFSTLPQNSTTQTCCQPKCTFCALLCARMGLMLTPTVPLGMLLCFKSAELGSLFNNT